MTTTTGDRSRPVPRGIAPAGDNAPPRRSGRHAGYPGKAQLDLAENALRAALARLARDADPDARLSGALIASRAAEALDGYREAAERASTAHKRQQALAEALAEQLDQLRKGQ